MKSILRALALTGVLGLGAAAAQARAGIYVGIGGGDPYYAAVPPCPGPGYFWSAGYYNGPVFVPGRWIYRGYDRDAYARSYSYGNGYRVFDRDDHRGNRDMDRRGDDHHGDRGHEGSHGRH